MVELGYNNMSDKFNWNDYEESTPIDKIENDSQSAFDWNSFEESTPSEAPSKLESAVRGGVQGATLDFADELTGGAEAVYETVAGDDKARDFFKNFQKYQKESDAKYTAAQEENPWSYGLGGVAGGLATMPFTGGLGAAKGAATAIKTGQGLGKAAGVGLKAGALTGVISGAGASKSNLTEDPMQVIQDAGTGAALGGAIGAGLPIVGKSAKGVYDGGAAVAKGVGEVGKYAAKKIPGVDMLTNAYKLGKKGLDLSKDNAQKVLTKMAEEDYASPILETIRKELQEPAKILNDLFDNSKSKLDVQKKLGAKIQELEVLAKGKKSTIQKEAKDLLNTIKNQLADVDRFDSKRFNEEVLEYKTSTQSKLDAAKTGKTLKEVDDGKYLNILPETPGKSKVINTVSNLNDNSAEKLNYALDKKMSQGAAVGDVPNLETVADDEFGHLIQNMDNKLGDSKQFNRLDYITNDLKPEISLQDARTLRNNVYDIPTTHKATQDIQNETRHALNQGIEDTLGPVGGQSFRDANTRSSDASTFMKEHFDFLSKNLDASGNKISTNATRTELAQNMAAKEGQLVSQQPNIMEYMARINPEAAAKMANSDFGAAKQVSRIMNPKEMLSFATIPRIAAIASQEAGRTVNKMSGKIASNPTVGLAKNMLAMTTQGLTTLADKVSPSSARLITAIADSPNETKRAALLFSASQNPEFRKDLKQNARELFGENEE